MKKTIALLLVLCMIFSVSPVALAQGSLSSTKNTFEKVVSMSDGLAYFAKNAQRTVSIVRSYTGDYLRCSFLFAHDADTIHRFVFTAEQISALLSMPGTNAFWAEAEAYAQANLEQAITISGFNVSEELVSSENSIPRNAVLHDFYEDLQPIYGAPYSNSLIATDSGRYPGLTMRVYESMEYKLTLRSSIPWYLEVAVFIDEFISIYLSISNPTNALVNAFALLYGTVVSIATFIVGSGTIYRYYCDIYYYRDVTINGSSYVYATAMRRYRFDGYDDMASITRAVIDTGSRSTTYSPSSSYFNQYLTYLIPDAYNMYQQAGQRSQLVPVP